MSTASLRSVAISMMLHAGLFGVAAAGSVAARRQRVVVAPLETTIAVESAGSAGSAGPAATEDPRPSPRTAEPPAPPRPARVPARRIVAAPPPPSPAAPTPAVAPAPVPPASAQVAPSIAPLPGTRSEDSTAPPNTARLEAGVAPAGTGTGAPGGSASQAGAGSGSGPANAAGDGRARLLASYLKGARERVARHKEYPYLARRASLEGTVCLRVVLAATGRVLEVTPTCGTAHRPLLDAALASVSSAAPFPPLPAALGQRLTFDVPVVFELDPL